MASCQHMPTTGRVYRVRIAEVSGREERPAQEALVCARCYAAVIAALPAAPPERAPRTSAPEQWYLTQHAVERFAHVLRRLRPTDVVRTLDRSARLELDLRLEAAAISEFKQNTELDEGFVVPDISWDHTAETVLTTTWVEGIPIRDLTAGFKCYRRRLLEALPLDKVRAEGYGFQIEMKYRAWRGGFRVVEVPIVFADRRVGQSKMSRRIMLEALTLVWRLRATVR